MRERRNWGPVPEIHYKRDKFEHKFAVVKDACIGSPAEDLEGIGDHLMIYFGRFVIYF